MDLSLIVVTDRRLAARPLLDVVKSALDGGARTFLLREKDLPRAERLALAEAMRALGADVIVAGPDPLGGDAVHLAASDAASTSANPIGLARLTGRSCHNNAEVMASIEDYVTLSPIFVTSSKPGYGPALGLDALASAVRAGRGSIGHVRPEGVSFGAATHMLQPTNRISARGDATYLLPTQIDECPAAVADGRHPQAGGEHAREMRRGKAIVALGGIDSPAKARACREVGAAGVAVMGAIMRADDPATVVKGLLP